MNITKKLVFLSLAFALCVEKLNAADKVVYIFAAGAATSVIPWAMYLKEAFFNSRVEKKVDALQTEVEGFRSETNTNFAGMNTRLDSMDTNMTTLTGLAKKTKGHVEILNFNLWNFSQKTTLTLAGLKKDFNTLNQKTDTLLSQVTKIREDQVTKTHFKQELDTFKQEITTEFRKIIREELAEKVKDLDKILPLLQGINAATTAGFLALNASTRSLRPSSSDHDLSGSSTSEGTLL